MLVATAPLSAYELGGFFEVGPNLGSFSSIVIATLNRAAQERFMSRLSEVPGDVWDGISEVFSHLKMRNGI